MLKNLPPAIQALLLQLFSVVLVFSAMRLFGFGPLVFVLLSGMLSAILSRLFSLAIWWQIIGFFFLPGIVATLALDIPPAFFLLAFLLMLAIYWRAYGTQVPLYLSSEKVWDALEGLLPEHAFRFVDLGSGLGGVLRHLAGLRPDGYFEGIEYAPLPFLVSRLRTESLPNCRVKWGSLWDCDLAEYDVVYAYLSPVPMEKLWRKAKEEMRPGTIFISSTFEVPGQEPDQRIEVDDLHRSTLLIWRMQALFQEAV